MDFAAARRAMVDGQIRPSDVMDTALLAAILDLPREAFVPPRLAALAYSDLNLPIDGEDAQRVPRPSRVLLKPAIEARLIQALAATASDRVLVVASGTGYSAALLARLGRSVTALEEDEALRERSRAVLARAGIDNVAVVAGPLVGGSPDRSPYDVVLIDGAVEFIPEALYGQLAPGGRLAAIMGSEPVGKAMLFQSDEKGAVSGRTLFDATAPLLPGFAKAKEFVF
jgi:protein-L-isoaspartate(D-aspartate) O-methyltransferase